ncbi:hypothetical protein [Paracoccus sp. NBH48]|uniref:GspE/PulE/PilB domain-containing protein n=1 Tax=Paracoccus sp. NBH48 TaxID=2596918 RepID=UPI0021055ED9|nr:hypothetical protein [Paracoccus sp. NBH48]
MVQPAALARALSRQWRTTAIDPDMTPADPRLIDDAGAGFCLTHGLLPWRRIGGVTWIATARPDDFAAVLPLLPRQFGQVRMLLCSADQAQGGVLNSRRTRLIREGRDARPRHRKLSHAGPGPDGTPGDRGAGPDRSRPDPGPDADRGAADLLGRADPADAERAEAGVFPGGAAGAARAGCPRAGHSTGSSRPPADGGGAAADLGHGAAVSRKGRRGQAGRTAGTSGLSAGTDRHSIGDRGQRRDHRGRAGRRAPARIGSASCGCPTGRSRPSPGR